MAISVVARRFHVNSGSLARYLNESDTPLLAIPLPDAGRGHAFFLRKDIAAQIQIPDHRMLRESSGTPHRGRSEQALGRVQAGEGNRVEKILKDDEEHVDRLESQLPLIKKMGYERYLSRQVREEH